MFRLDFTSSFKKTSLNKPKSLLIPNSTSMKRLPEKLLSKGCFSPFFCNLDALNLAYNYLKGLRAINIFKELKFEGTWDELEAKNYFQRQTFIYKKCETESSSHAK